MENKTFTIYVNAETTRIVESASEKKRRKFEALLSLKLGDEARSKRPLEEVISVISQNAQSRELTPEILDSILNEKIS